MAAKALIDLDWSVATTHPEKLVAGTAGFVVDGAILVALSVRVLQPVVSCGGIVHDTALGLERLQAQFPCGQKKK